MVEKSFWTERLTDFKNNKNRNYSFRRFALSFLLVLILPIVFFTLLFFTNFYRQYRNQLETQAQMTLDASAMELERTLESLQTIVSYNAQQEHMQYYNMPFSYSAYEIVSTLASEVVTHPILDNIFYYHDLSKDRFVYSAAGTFSTKYFVNIYTEYTCTEDFFREMEKIQGHGWRIWGESDPKLYYIIRISSFDWWIFSLKSTKIQEILNQNNSDTILLGPEGERLFSADFQQLEEKKDTYKLYSVAPSEKFQLIRYMESKLVFENLNNWRNLYFVVLFGILIVGGILVFVLASYHQRPLRKLQDYCREQVPNIPSTVRDYDVFWFVMKKKEEQLKFLEERRKKDLLLLQMLYGRENNSGELQSALSASGLFRQAAQYRVVLAEASQECLDRVKVSRFLEMEMSKEVECHVADITSAHTLVMVVGIVENGEQYLEKFLRHMQNWFIENIKCDLNFHVGIRCIGTEEIYDSYQEVIRTAVDDSGKLTKEIVFCKRVNPLNKSVVYPDMELDTLYEALVEADVDKADMLTVVLCDFLRQQENQRFIRTSLYYDIVNTYVRAWKKLALNEEGKLLEFNLLNMQGMNDAVETIRNIWEWYRSYIEKEEGKKDPLISSVIDFIDANVGNYNLCVSMVADHFQISISNLSHQFKAQTDKKVSDYIAEQKFSYASLLLQETDYSVQKISDMVGYSRADSFGRKFKRHYGLTPAEYRAEIKETKGVSSNE